MQHMKPLWNVWLYHHHSAVKLKLLKAEEQHALKEATMSKSITNLTKERDKLLRTSVEQENAFQVGTFGENGPRQPERIILCYTLMSLQEKLEELRLLEQQYKDLKRAQTKAEER